MSEILEKAAGLTPDQLFLLSMMAGGGTFGGLRLLSDLHNKVSPYDTNQDKIKLMMPNKMDELRNKHNNPNQISTSSPTPSSVSSISGISKMSAVGNIPAPPPWWSYWLAPAAGLPLGFLGAKGVYDKYQQVTNDDKIEKAKKQYLNQLSLAQQMNKTAEETPLVDAFCESAAKELEKSAVLGSDYVVDTIGSHLAKNPDLFKSTTNDPLLQQNAADTIKGNAYRGIGHVANTLSGGTGKVGLEALVGLTGITGIGMLGFLLKNHMDKKQKEMKAQYPSGIAYE